MRTTLLVLLSAWLITGCNNIPVGSLQKSFSVKVTQSKDKSPPVQVDFLWVIDNSASMCQEQAQLAGSFDDFLTQIESFVNIDYRIAVVTTDMLSDDHSGRFQAKKATEFPFACVEAEITHCLRGAQGDEVCAEKGEDWLCESPDEPKKVINCNGSLNSRCRKLCQEGWECDDAFVEGGASDECKSEENSEACVYKCLTPSKDPKNSGCVLRPGTNACPDEAAMRETMLLGSGLESGQGRCATGEGCWYDQGCADGSACLEPAVWLTRETAGDLFKCVGVVGAEQHSNANLEQGLNAAITALDKGGIRGDQAKQFLRDDAYLVIIFVSDEEDCSTVDGESLKKEQYGTCTCRPDATEGGMMRPVPDAINRIKALKGDPGRVLVAAIVGDSTAEIKIEGTDDIDPVETEVIKNEDRLAYFQSKCTMCEDPSDHHPHLFNTYICQSARGKADFGSRYVRFVKGFGANGILTNICDDSGIGPALEKIADRIIRVFTKVCLPRPVLGIEACTDNDDTTTCDLVVEKIGPAGMCADGTTPCCVENSTECSDTTECGDGGACIPNKERVPFGDTEGTFSVVTSSDCEETEDKKAILFNFLFAPGTSVLVDYEAVPKPSAAVTQ